MNNYIAADLDAQAEVEQVKRKFGGLRSVLLAACLLGCAAILFLVNVPFREFEALTAASWLRFMMPPEVFASTDAVIATSIPDGPIAFRITSECTAIVLIAPILTFGAVLSLRSAHMRGRILAATAIGVSVVFAVNQVRIGIIVLATQLFGLKPGYEISHVFVGSVIGIVGFIAGIVLMLRVLASRRRL